MRVTLSWSRYVVYEAPPLDILKASVDCLPSSMKDSYVSEEYCNAHGCEWIPTANEPWCQASFSMSLSACQCHSFTVRLAVQPPLSYFHTHTPADHDYHHANSMCALHPNHRE